MVYPRQRNRLVAAALATAVATVLSSKAHAVTLVTGVASDDATIQPGGPRTGGNGKTFFNIEDGSNGVNASFGVIDFAAANFPVGNNSVTGIESMELDMANAPSSFSATAAAPVNVNFYLSTNTSASIQPGTSTLIYQTGQTPDGVGNQLGSLILLGTGQYSNNTANGTYFPGYTLTLTPDAQTDIENQLNNLGDVRIVVAATGPSFAAKGATFGGSTFTSPQKITFGLDLTPLGANDSVLQVADTLNGGVLTKMPTTVVFPRVYKSATNATVSFTLNNSGTDSTIYSATSAAGSVANGIANGIATVGAEPVVGGGSTTITAGIAPSNIGVGAGVVTSTITIQNQHNANDGNITINVQANDVVSDRFIDTAGSDADATHTGAGVDIGRVLIGKGSVTMNVTLDTENDTSTNAQPGLKDSTVYTEVRLLANTTITPTGTTPNTNFKDAVVTLNAGTKDQDFVDGTESTTRTVTIAPVAGSGGTYTAAGANYDFLSFPLTNIDSAVGLNPIGSVVPTAEFGRVNIGGTLYQQASITTTGTTATTLVFANAKHTVLTVTPINTSTATDIGLRVAAQITGTTLVAQNGFSVTGFASGTVVNDGSNTTASVIFASGGKLNGLYTGNLTVTSQTSDQTINGASLNDIAPVVYALSSTVAGNVGSGTANILAGGSFSGYNIARGSGKNSLVKFLGGTSTAGDTISVAWTDGVNTTLSDRANITKTASDLLVVQLSYDSTAVTGGTATAPVLALPNASGQYVSAVLKDSSGTPVEINGAYDGNLVLGHYGIDTVNHTVWAVVDAQGQFEAVQRLAGDANGDGKVDLTDLSTVLNGFGATTALWSAGNFDGAPTIDLTDLSDVLNNFGASIAGSTVETASPLIGAPEPASLGVMTLGMICLLKRRR